MKSNFTFAAIKEKEKMFFSDIFNKKKEIKNTNTKIREGYYN